MHWAFPNSHGYPLTPAHTDRLNDTSQNGKYHALELDTAQLRYKLGFSRNLDGLNAVNNGVLA